MATAPRDGCAFGWVIVVNNTSIPTVSPCPAHRPILFRRWKRGHYMPDRQPELEVVR